MRCMLLDTGRGKECRDHDKDPRGDGASRPGRCLVGGGAGVFVTGDLSAAVQSSIVLRYPFE